MNPMPQLLPKGDAWPPPSQPMFLVLRRLQESRITLVEWETPLLQRLGYPLPDRPDLIFLIPDEQMQTARYIIQQAGLQHNRRTPITLSEHSGMGTCYTSPEYDGILALVPLSWTGIELRELTPIENPAQPCCLWTVPIPAFCAAYLRIIANEGPRNETMSMIAIGDLSNVVGYTLFGMSYDGNCLPALEDVSYDGEDAAQKEAQDMENALQSIGRWNFAKNSEWARWKMVQLVSGSLDWWDLPNENRRRTG
ncbi:hypothetical protein FGRMN_10363 [Fusarium graminum]|nr:hypothetical protein FGRMN_10363 [Fusarium graminum]